jgi:hypothetical protein
MPYSPDNAGDVKKVKEKLQKTYSNVSDEAARQAIHVFNSVMASSGDEGRAWASVYSVMNDRGLSKKASVRPSARRVAHAYAQARSTSKGEAVYLSDLTPEARRALATWRRGERVTVTPTDGVAGPGRVTSVTHLGGVKEPALTYVSVRMDDGRRAIVRPWNLERV